MIKVKDLWKSFGENQVLTGIDLHIPRGETLVVMGPSGCGKSVLLRLLTGLMKPDRGQIWFDGLEISTFSKKKFLVRDPGGHENFYLIQKSQLF